MEKTALQKPAPRQQKEVEILGDVLTAVQMEDGSIYLPVKLLCEVLGLERTAQVRRIKRDETMSEDLYELTTQTGRGGRDAQYLRLEVVPYWLSGVTVSKVKPELKDKMLAYKRWVVRKVYEAFLSELAAETKPSLDVQNLLSVKEIGLALVQFADEQLALEAKQALLFQRQDTLETQYNQTAQDVEVLKLRVNNAASVVGQALTRIQTLENRTAPGIITEEQAAELSLSVKQVASELARREQKEGNPYQRVFMALYQRYGVTTYKRLPQASYTGAMDWLNEWYNSLIAPQGETGNA